MIKRLDVTMQGMKTNALLLCLGLIFASAGCSKKTKPQEVRDYNSIRADLRVQVETGKLTREEAIVKLAEAQAKFGSKQRKKESKVSPELEALGKALKEKVAEGGMTGEEAKAAWFEAAGIDKDKKDSAKEKK